MGLSAPPIQEQIQGDVPRTWVGWFTDVWRLLNNRQPQQLPTYAVSAVPAASGWTGHVIYVSDESGGAVLAFSDGTNWRRVTDRNTIS